MFGKSCFFISPGGCTVDVMDADGVVVGTFGLPAGKVSVAPYLPLFVEGGDVKFNGDVTVWHPPHAAGIQKYGEGSHDSGANPDWKPTSATRLEREMRGMLNKVAQQSSVLDARLAALNSIREPQVVETVPEAPPTTEAAPAATTEPPTA